MTVRRFSDGQAYCERAFDFLMRDEARHNLMLGLCTALTSSPDGARPPSYMATVEAADRVLGAAVRTPPYNVVLSDMPPHAVVWLARDMHITHEPLPGVNGPTPQVDLFARAWERLTGQQATVRRRMRIYRLESVTPALRAPGCLRRATLDDLPLVVGWFSAFVREALGDEPAEDDALRIERRIRDGIVYLWLPASRGADPQAPVPSGFPDAWDSPVSMACSGGTTPNGVRISGVYTPPEFRGRGFASAAVAALSRRLLDEGRRYCFLYTDLDNPTSNRIYQDIGYYPVCDAKDISF